MAYKVLNIKGAVLVQGQLEKYLEKLASDQVLQEKSEKNGISNTNIVNKAVNLYEFV